MMYSLTGDRFLLLLFPLQHLVCWRQSYPGENNSSRIGSFFFVLIRTWHFLNHKDNFNHESTSGLRYITLCSLFSLCCDTTAFNPIVREEENLWRILQLEGDRDVLKTIILLFSWSLDRFKSHTNFSIYAKINEDTFVRPVYYTTLFVLTT